MRATKRPRQEAQEAQEAQAEPSLPEKVESILTAADVAQFATAGWVRVPQAFARDAALEMQGVMWSQLERSCGLRQGQRSSWAAEEEATAPSQSNGLKDLKHHPAFRTVGSPRLCGALDQLLGQGAWAPPKSWGSFLATFPGRVLGSCHAQPAAWRIPRAGAGTGWHWDGDPGPDAVAAGLLSPDERPTPHRWPAVQVMTFHSDVAPGGGGTVLLEGSHVLVERFFREQAGARNGSLKQNPLKSKFAAAHPWIQRLSTGPEHRLGSTDACCYCMTEHGGHHRTCHIGQPGCSCPHPVPEWVCAAEEAHTIECMETGTVIDGVSLRVVECSGKAGDAILWHSGMYHSSSVNCAQVPRFMRNCCIRAQ